MKKLTTFKKGTEAYLHGRRCQILGTAGSRSVRVIYVDGGETVRTDIDNLWIEPPEVEGQLPSIDILHPKSLEVAEYRYSIIEPVLALINRPENDQSLNDLFAEIQAKHGRSRATLYRWMNRYLIRGLLSDLAPRNRKRHRRRLDSKLDEIIDEELKVILAGKRRTLQKMHRNVADQCRQLGLRVPGISTIRQRVKALPPRAIVAARLGPKAAHDMYDQILKHYPGATYPLAYVQIDHTLLDITIVSGRDRLPIGKVWLTVAIDVYSRMIVGIYVSLEAPSTFSTCMCIRRAVLPKEDYLLSVGVNGDWPVWGFMRNLNADNGSDFRSEEYRENLRQYGCWPIWRLLKKPEYGGHVERLIGTINRVLHEVPGTTFSNPQERREYDSEGNAIFTIDELEQAITHWIVNIYHKRFHENLGCTPLEKWEAGILGTDGSPGVGLQDRVEDPERVAIDLLPFSYKTVQRNGVTWSRITYNSEALAPWVRAAEGKQGKKFKVRRDPRDITCIWFLDPETGEYHRLIEETRQMRPISIWEHKAARRHAEERGLRVQSTLDILDAHREFDRMVEAAEEKTKTVKGARRKREKRRRHEATYAQESYAQQAAPIRPKPAKQAGPRLVVNNVRPTAKQLSDDQDLNLTAEDLIPKAEEI